MKRFYQFIKEGKAEEDKINQLLDKGHLTEDEKELLQYLSSGKNLKDWQKQFDPFGEELPRGERNVRAMNFEEIDGENPGERFDFGDGEFEFEDYNDQNKNTLLLKITDVSNNPDFQMDMYLPGFDTAVSFWRLVDDSMVDDHMLGLFPEIDINEQEEWDEAGEGVLLYGGGMSMQQLRNFLINMGFPNVQIDNNAFD